jgi:predicted dehydrogenase
MSKTFSPNRRDFLRTGVAVAGACFALPTWIPRTALAAAGQPGANDRIGIGCIGVGRRSQQLMPKVPQAGRFVAVADIWLTQAQKIAAKYDCLALQDYRRLLERKDVDAVMIATPDHWHALCAIHACQAMKDAYVEKPLALTIIEGRKIVEAARKYKRIVQCGSQQRTMGPNIHGCAMIREGVIGKVHTVVAFNYPSPWEVRFPAQTIPEGLDWDVWCGQAEVLPFNNDIYPCRANPGWASLRPFAGGEMCGWGAHGLDQVQWALGMDSSGPVEVWTEGEKFAPPTFTEPHAVKEGDAKTSRPKVLFRYANGTVVKLDDGPRGGAIFIGEKGKITIDRNSCKVSPAELDTAPKRSKTKTPDTETQIQNWFDCMISRDLPSADVEIGHRTATVCHLGNIARWANRKLTWDPAHETFPGDEEVRQYLGRPQRKPYQMPETI